MGQNVSKFLSFRRQSSFLLSREKPPEVKSGLTLDHQKYFFANDDDSSPFWSVLLQLKLI